MSPIVKHIRILLVIKLLLLVLFSDSLGAQDKDTEIEKKSVKLPFKFAIGMGYYKPWMEDANRYFIPYKAGKFDGDKDFIAKIIFKKKHFYDKLNYIISFNYFTDSIQENDPHKSLTEKRPYVENPSYLTTETEKVQLIAYVLLFNLNYNLTMNRLYGFSFGVGTGPGWTKMRYSHVRTIIDGFAHEGYSYKKGLIPVQTYFSVEVEINEDFNFSIDATYIYMKWAAKNELGYDVDASGILINGVLILNF